MNPDLIRTTEFVIGNVHRDIIYWRKAAIQACQSNDLDESNQASKFFFEALVKKHKLVNTLKRVRYLR